MKEMRRLFAIVISASVITGRMDGQLVFRERIQLAFDSLEVRKPNEQKVIQQRTASAWTLSVTGPSYLFAGTLFMTTPAYGASTQNFSDYHIAIGGFDKPSCVSVAMYMPPFLELEYDRVVVNPDGLSGYFEWDWAGGFRDISFGWSESGLVNPPCPMDSCIPQQPDIMFISYHVDSNDGCTDNAIGCNSIKWEMSTEVCRDGGCGSNQARVRLKSALLTDEYGLCYAQIASKGWTLIDDWTKQVNDQNYPSVLSDLYRTIVALEVLYKDRSGPYSAIDRSTMKYLLKGALVAHENAHIPGTKDLLMKMVADTRTKREKCVDFTAGCKIKGNLLDEDALWEVDMNGFWKTVYRPISYWIDEVMVAQWTEAAVTRRVYDEIRMHFDPNWPSLPTRRKNP
jgi:hypothetical protein